MTHIVEAPSSPIPTRCPSCASPLYDPHETGIAAECAWCGLVVYTPDRDEPFPRRWPTHRERGR